VKINRNVLTLICLLCALPGAVAWAGSAPHHHGGHILDGGGTSPSRDGAPRIVGVTQESVYTRIARATWYPRTGTTAQIIFNSGPSRTYGYDEHLTTVGNYALTVFQDADPAQAATVNFSIAETSGNTAVIQTHGDQTGAALTIEFQGSTSPIRACWAEDLSGNRIQDIYVSNGAAANHMEHTGQANRPGSVPVWAHKAGKLMANGTALAVPEEDIPPDIDAASGATMHDRFTIQSRLLSGAFPGNRAKIFFEINRSFDTSWYFTQAMTGHVGEPSLVYAAEIATDEPGTYHLGGTQLGVEPVGYGRYDGTTGEIYTDFYKDRQGVPTYIFEHAPDMVERLVVQVTPAGEEPTLEEAVVSLQIAAGATPGSAISDITDINGDGKIGIAEAIYTLTTAAGTNPRTDRTLPLK